MLDTCVSGRMMQSNNIYMLQRPGDVYLGRRSGLSDKEVMQRLNDEQLVLLMELIREYDYIHVYNLLNDFGIMERRDALIAALQRMVKLKALSDKPSFPIDFVIGCVRAAGLSLSMEQVYDLARTTLKALERDPRFFEGPNDEKHRAINDLLNSFSRQLRAAGMVVYRQHTGQMRGMAGRLLREL